MPDQMQPDDSIAVRLRTSAAVFTCATLTVCFFGVINLYIVNAAEFSLTAAEIIFATAPYLLISIVLFLAACFLLSFPLFQRLISFTLALSILLWLQGNILVWDYGIFDGSPIPWDSNRWRGIFDLSVWTVLLLLSIVFYRAFSRHAASLAILLIIVQGISLASTVIRHDHLKTALSELFTTVATDSVQDKTERLNKLYRFSKDKNVLILLWDGLPSNFFQTIINEKPEFRDTLRGFTYYRNTIAHYPVTYASVPSMLSGKLFDLSTSFDEYIDSLRTLPEIMLEHGYQSDFLTLRPEHRVLGRGSNIWKYDDFFELGDAGTAHVEQSRFLALLMLRHAPHFLKRIIYEQQSGFFAQKVHPRWSGKGSTSLSSDGQDATLYLIDLFERNAYVEGTRPTFKFLHFSLPHFPLRLDSNCRNVKRESSPAAYKDQVICTIRQFRRVIDRLKALGIYDQTLILAVSDHGVGYPVQGSRIGGLFTNATNSLALFLIKNFGSSEDFSTSNAPVSLSDIPITVMDALDIEQKLPGRSIFTLKENEKRTRLFRVHKWARGFNSEKIPKFESFALNGDAWRTESWTPTNTIELNPRHRDDFKVSNIDFGTRESRKHLSYYGWLGTAKETRDGQTFIESNRPQAAFHVILEADEDIQMQLHAAVYPPGRAIQVEVNGHVVGELSNSAMILHQFNVNIPRDYVRDNEVNTINFVLGGDTTLLFARILLDEVTFR